MRHLRQDIRFALPSLALGLAIVLSGGSALRADLNEDFEGGTTNTPLTLEWFNSDPGGLFGVQEAGGNPGGYLEITTDGVNDNRNYAYFDRTAEGAYETINFSFDLLIGPQEASADGGSIAFISTDIFGSTGGVEQSLFEVPEDPAQVGVLGIGFDTWANTGIGDGEDVDGGDGSTYNDVTLYYNGAKIDQFYNADQPDVLPNGIRIDNDTWHTVAGTIDFIGQTASMTINGMDVWENLSVPNLTPFESRVMFGARTGGENENFFVDNVSVEYVGQTTVEELGPQPEPTAGNWSVREWKPFGREINGIEGADEIINDPTLQNRQVVREGMREMVNFADPQAPGGGYSIVLPKEPFLTNTPADDNDFVMRAIAKVVIPEDGDYTFGIDGDDATRLRLEGANFTYQGGTEGGEATGEVLQFPTNTGNAFSLASTFLAAGEYDIEVTWQERGGGAFVEVFAAPGVKEADDVPNAAALIQEGFSPVGLKEEIVVAQGTTPTTSGQWSVRSVQVDPTFESSVEGAMGLNNLEDARAAIALDDNDPLVIFSTENMADVINYNDPDTNGTGAGRFQPDDPFPIDLLGTDDNDFATLATVTVSITEENDYIFGFGSDDGAGLTLEGANFTILNPGGVREVTNDGQTIEFNANTGNSDTFAVTHLTPGDYELEFLTWERGGGAWAEVYAGVGDNLLSFLTTAQLLGMPPETFDLILSPGLQLAGEGLPPGIPGDFNGNGLVEQEDLDLVLANWGDPAAEAPGTWVNDLPEGNIDQTELDKVLVNWGNTAGLGTAEGVPEPSSIALLLIVAALGFGWLRRR